MKNSLLIIDCGLQPYRDTWNLQHRLVSARIEGRICDTLVLVEHLPIVTLGRNADPGSLKVSPEILEQQGFSCVVVERGGDVTFHGPGQLVGYPIFLLPGKGRKIRAFVESLEEVMIQVLGAFNIAAHRRQGAPGVWIDEAKIGAVGITVRNQVSFHGFALNVNNDLSGFSLIHPCGIRDGQVTSVEQCLGKRLSMEPIKEAIIEQCARILNREVVRIPHGSFQWDGLGSGMTGEERPLE